MTEKTNSMIIIGAELYTPTQLIAPGALWIHEDQIMAVGEPEIIIRMEPSARLIDIGNGKIMPGLIDLHIHGAQGYDALGKNLSNLSDILPKLGVTSFLPTTYPVQPETFLDDLAVMAKIILSPSSGAIPLGIHLEGPYLSPHKPGMCAPNFLYPMTEDNLVKILDASRQTIRMITFAPEEGTSIEMIPDLIRRGIVPSIGHSDADFETVTKAVQLGLNHATHTFNAMSGLHHRKPGVVGAVLHFPEIVAQMIADGHHIHPAVMDLLIRVKGVERVCLVSDAQPYAGMPDGCYPWGPYEMVIKNGSSHLKDGTIAGSVKLMNQMLGVLVEQVGISLSEAITMGTKVPANVLGLNKGQLRPGFDADVTVLDNHYEAILTMVGGKIVHQAFPE